MKHQIKQNWIRTMVLAVLALAVAIAAVVPSLGVNLFSQTGSSIQVQPTGTMSLLLAAIAFLSLGMFGRKRKPQD